MNGRREKTGELMRISLKKASIRDAEAIHRLQVASFLPLLHKYRDCETNPANEDVERVIDRLKQPHTTYYFIILDGMQIGAIRIIYNDEVRRARISPMFIVPEHQGRDMVRMLWHLLRVLLMRSAGSLRRFYKRKAIVIFMRKWDTGERELRESSMIG